MLNIVIFGAPGSGKGTQSDMIIKKYGLFHISTGDVLRAEMKNGTELGKIAEGYISKGQLVPDELIIDMLAKVLDSNEETKNGVIFDGFPRTIPQAEALVKAGIPIDDVVEIAVPDEVILERMSGRRVHVASGRTYHVKFNPPKVEGVDDVTGEPLIQRPDDKEETVKKRLEVYHTQTEALVGFYQSLVAKGDSKTKYIKIDGVGDVNEVSRRIFDALDR